jgi:hypothetical protein
LKSIIENNVIITVGSLPDFASFMCKYVAEPAVYKFLEFKGDWQQKDSMETFGGSGNQRKKLSYYELSDKPTLKSHITVPGETHIATDNRY